MGAVNRLDHVRDLLARLAADEALAVLERLPPGPRREFLVWGLPVRGEWRDALVRWVAGRGDTGDQRAALGNPHAGDRRDVVAALADAADPGIRTAVYLHPHADPVLRRRMLTDGPYAKSPPDELRRALLATRSRHLLGPARDAADPDIARHATREVRGPRYQEPPRIPAEAYAWLDVPVPRRSDAEKSRGVPPRLGPRARRARARFAAMALESWTAADWTAFTELHRKRPLDPMTTSRLVAHPACPPSAAMSMLRDSAAHPEESGSGFREVAEQALLSGALTAGDLYAHAAPAAQVLRVFAFQGITEDRDPVPDLVEVKRLMTEDVRTRLADDPVRWWSLLALLHTDFPGTIPDLLDAAASSPPTIAPLSAEGDPRLGGSPWTLLLSLADPDRTTAIVTDVAALAGGEHVVASEMARCWELPHMPTETVEGFLTIANQRQLVRFAGQRQAGEDLLIRLVALDEPEVNAVLLRNHAMPVSVRRRILSGTSHATGRPDSLPLHPSVEASGGRFGGMEDKHFVHSHDPERIAAVLDADSSICAAYQAAGCRRLLELDRFDLVATFARRTDRVAGALPFPVVAEALRAPVTSGDEVAAHHALRDLSARLFRQDLTTPNLDDLRCHFEVDPATDWSAVAAELRGKPIPDGLAAVLAESGENLPDELARTLLADDPAACARHLAPRSAELANLALDAAPMARSLRRNGQVQEAWAELCVRKGLFTVEELVARGHPARGVLRAFQHHRELRERADAAIRDLIARHGPLSQDTLHVAALLLDDFAGTLPELLTTAVAATTV